MQRADREYLHIEAGLSQGREGLPPSAGRRVSEAEKRALAERLRQRGWSYRRIADDLRVSYRTVSVWLDGPPAEEASPTALPVRFEPRRPAVAPSRPPAPRPAGDRDLVERLLRENAALSGQIDRLIAVNVAQHKAILDLEARLTALIEGSGRRLVERLLRGVRLLVGRSRSR